jgi:hypothetical protein
MQCDCSNVTMQLESQSLGRNPSLYTEQQTGRTWQLDGKGSLILTPLHTPWLKQQGCVIKATMDLPHTITLCPRAHAYAQLSSRCRNLTRFPLHRYPCHVAPCPALAAPGDHTQQHQHSAHSPQGCAHPPSLPALHCSTPGSTRQHSPTRANALARGCNSSCCTFSIQPSQTTYRTRAYCSNIPCRFSSALARQCSLSHSKP